MSCDRNTDLGSALPLKVEINDKVVGMEICTFSLSVFIDFGL